MKRRFLEKVTETQLLHGFQDCPFSQPAHVRSARMRPTPHWHRIMVGRHFGLHRPDATTCNWMARSLTQGDKYIQRCLGPAMPGDRKAVPYDLAVKRAVEWFMTGDVGAEAHHPKHRKKMSELSICPIGDVYTVGHALADYLKWSKFARSEGGHYNNLVLINYHLVPLISWIPIEEFNGQSLQKVASAVVSRPPRRGFQVLDASDGQAELNSDDLRRRKRTFNSLVTILRMAFRYAWENGHLESERSWKCLNRVSVVHQPRTIFLSREECRHLIASCEPALRKLVLGGLYTGCRVGELATLRVSDVAREGFGVSIAAVKRSPPRFVYLPDEGMRFFLQECHGKAPNDLVFRSPAGLPWKKQHSRMFRRAVARAGLPSEFVFHGLRHTYASELLRQGAFLDTVAKQLGHANTLTVIKTYGHLAARDREEQVRNCFAPLQSEHYQACQENETAIQELRDTLRAGQRELYRITSPITSTPRVSHARPSIEVMRVFDGLERNS